VIYDGASTMFPESCHEHNPFPNQHDQATSDAKVEEDQLDGKLLPCIHARDGSEIEPLNITKQITSTSVVPQKLKEHITLRWRRKQQTYNFVKSYEVLFIKVSCAVSLHS